ncbi:MAG: hypothetical protein KJ804_07495 [Proteobacteria bacterium]|nr:hypothetical protein [Pseudomonadota bacterium]MBU1058144.1 hypothetical protein [Pseudomonadota bacterium]
MENKKNSIKNPDPQRVALLRSLPLEIKETLSGEEAAAFINGEPLSETLYEKLKNYLVPIDE